MIAQVRGIVAEKSPTRVVLDVSGVGYEINIPVSTYEKLPNVGGEIRLLTHLHVREDAMQLFGFSNDKEKKLFQLLIAVSGIGPRLALGVLSGISVEDFSLAVRNENSAMLTRIPGVGKKTAQRLVIELKDKIGKGLDVSPAREIGSVNILEEAVLALVSLGYRQTEAQKIVEKVAGEEESLPSIEVLIKKALQTVVSKR
ncbi:MAG TPA: Holliday junction branch migration protein RuvA [Bacteroidetes bacterium]|nr:Holliday junction branch migration protein RuvA [Bacteroidota bacterium]